MTPDLAQGDLGGCRLTWATGVLRTAQLIAFQCQEMFPGALSFTRKKKNPSFKILTTKCSLVFSGFGASRPDLIRIKPFAVCKEGAGPWHLSRPSAPHCSSLTCTVVLLSPVHTWQMWTGKLSEKVTAHNKRADLKPDLLPQIKVHWMQESTIPLQNKIYSGLRCCLPNTAKYRPLQWFFTLSRLSPHSYILRSWKKKADPSQSVKFSSMEWASNWQDG